MLVIAWLLTYLLHGTLLLGLAWLVSKPLSRWSVSAEETVWKLALVGALFTASLQLAAGWEPVAGRWGLANLSAPVVAEERLVPSRTEANPAPALRPLRSVRSGLPAAPRPEIEAPAPMARLSMPSIPAMVLGMWALGVCLLLAGYVRSHSLLRRRLKARPRVVGGTLHSQLRALAAEAGFPEDVRLTCSSRVPVPLALGLRRPEICVPPKALAGLTHEQQEGMLAHELAHLARRDPLWLVVSHVLSCVFFFQPLNWVARRRLREISEMLSDEWAVSRTGRPLSLAGCLAEVAGWSVARRSLPVPSMADRPSHLAQRIRRLLDKGRSPESPARRVWLGAAMIVLLIAVAAAAPAVSAHQEAQGKQARAAHAEAVASAAVAAPETWMDKSSGAAAAGEAEDPQEHEVAEEHDFDRHQGDHDGSDHRGGQDFDFDFDFDFGEVDGIVEGALASVDVGLEALDGAIDNSMDRAMEGQLTALDAELDALDGQLDSLDGELEQLSRDHELSEADQEKLEEEIERANEKIHRTLAPQMEKLSRELSEKMSRDLPTAEMRKVEEEMKRLGERMGPSEEELARMRSQIDAELRKHRDEARLSREERKKIVQDARRMAEQYKPSEEQRQEMKALARRHQALADQYRTEHQGEIEKATREMREAVDLQMRAVREELRRTVDQRRQIEQEERRESREKSREKEIRKDRKDDEQKQKPPKMVLKLDVITGKLELVPEVPGC
jgi:beta-lactamase regulating signal transducer with metallopeptidase domain